MTLTKIIQSVCAWWRRDGEAFNKMEALFQRGNVLEHTNGERYRVSMSADLCFAVVRNLSTHKDLVVDWLTPAGTPRHHVIGQWQLVSTPADVAREHEAMFAAA